MVKSFDPINRNPLLYLLPSYIPKIITVDQEALVKKIFLLQNDLKSGREHSDREILTKFVDSALKIISS